MIDIIMDVNLSALDLNLFLVLHAVLEERSAESRRQPARDAVGGAGRRRRSHITGVEER